MSDPVVIRQMVPGDQVLVGGRWRYRKTRSCTSCGKTWTAASGNRECSTCTGLRRGKAYSTLHHRKLRDASADRPRPAQCEVCHATPRGRQQVLSWDHNHGTKKFRGWLCENCNRALGLAGDNPVVLRALAQYLERHGCSPTRPLIR